jgi:hypothetical protein
LMVGVGFGVAVDFTSTGGCSFFVVLMGLVVAFVFVDWGFLVVLVAADNGAWAATTIAKMRTALKRRPGTPGTWEEYVDIPPA